MRRLGALILLLAALTLPAAAQFGKSITVEANTPEDKALLEIYAATDPAQKIALLDKFMEEFGKGDLALLADELYVSAYASAKNYDKAFEYGDKVLALDPDNLQTAVDLSRAAQEKGDIDKEFAYGERVGAIVARFKAQPAPTGTLAANWAAKQAEDLAKVKDNIDYVEGVLYGAAYQLQDPSRKAALLERFLTVFPDTPYAENAQTLVAAAYQQARDFAKMVAFAQKVLTLDPNNISMRVLLADFWSDRGEQLDQAEASAKKALVLLESAKKPPQVTDDQWREQVALQEGISHSALGQIYVNRGRNSQAVDAFKQASPLLKPNNFYYGRNLYRLGFTLAKMQRIPEARAVLTDAIAVDSPYRPLAQQTLDKIGGPTRPARRPH